MRAKSKTVRGPDSNREYRVRSHYLLARASRQHGARRVRRTLELPSEHSSEGEAHPAPEMERG